MAEEYPFDHFAGELLPGDTGWLPLDEFGEPAGPAVLDPPPPPALACSVSLTSDGHLVSSSGAPLETPLNSNVEKRPEGYGDTEEELEEELELISLNPDSAGMDDPDFTLECIGQGFTPYSVIVFNGGRENTVFVSPTKITTIVKPSLVSVPITIPVQVEDNSTDEVSDALDFEFTPAEGEGAARRRR